MTERKGPVPKRQLTVRTKIAAPMGDAEEEDVLEYLRTFERVKAYKEARNDLLRFAQLMMPSPDNPDDPNQSQYIVAPHHALMAHALHKVERGELPRLIITMPTRHW